MLILALALAQSATAAAPRTGPMETYGDWVVACDNGRRCEMTSLFAQDGSQDDQAWQMAVTREAGPKGGWKIDLFGDDLPPGATIRVEGGPVAPAAVWRAGRLDEAAALALAGAMANGRTAVIRDRTGKTLGSVSLTGSSAALRFIDAQQGRAGTVTAAVARGPRPAASVPAAPPLPGIASVRPGGTPATLSPALREKLWRDSKCGENYDDGDRPDLDISALGGGATLVLIPCGAGAYNFSYAPYIVRAGKAAVAQFDMSPAWGEDGGVPLLVNSGFDAKTGELSSYAKGRGLGDCGSAETYVWDGTRFRLVEARSMGECRGSTNWLVTWRARAVAK